MADRMNTSLRSPFFRAVARAISKASRETDFRAIAGQMSGGAFTSLPQAQREELNRLFEARKQSEVLA